ncbi:hypothetical protein GJ496_002312 [Pomphorhynchus laevis]|nr:hypothetical protein GJ496_002312 [Pomphorhynchus laevis]
MLDFFANIAESSNPDAQGHLDEDVNAMRSLVSNLFATHEANLVKTLRVYSLFCLGNLKTCSNSRPLLLKAVFSSADNVQIMMSKSHRSKGGNIRILKDLSLDRKALKIAKQELLMRWFGGAHLFAGTLYAFPKLYEPRKARKFRFSNKNVMYYSLNFRLCCDIY